MYIGKRVIGSIVGVIALAVILFGVWNSIINTGGAENPSMAIGEFMIAIKGNNYKEARTYLTKDAASMYDEYKLDRIKKVITSTLAINSPSSVEIRGKFATGVIGDANGILYNVNLEKVKGKWRISSIK